MHYAPTRQFYLRHGYDREAVLRGFYADGDDMVVFRKRLVGTDDSGPSEVRRDGHGERGPTVES